MKRAGARLLRSGVRSDGQSRVTKGLTLGRKRGTETDRIAHVLGRRLLGSQISLRCLCRPSCDDRAVVP